ncbi:manganese efflux pump MntP [Paludifilum halophilum]|uniref:Putative manganese efflux pump MntP n=1 Tax=Paludifilum halophilum TaxID=1642702 RepID=A0A235B6S5_9BACL|nr:manganese efflux pump [Paludifilum halophilum]OYD08000.1 hypothetical protein CHM34_07735 [Paludifilum halophilum]
MELSLPQWGQLFTLLMIAIALGMDAFSLGVGVGVRGVLMRQVFAMSGIIGFFHIMMPLLGILIGHVLSSLVENIAVMAGGGLLCFLGGHMVVHALKGENESILSATTPGGILLFSFSVSLDSLSAGLSLGLFEADALVAASMFGIIGGLMNAAGLLLGRHVGTWIGEYGEAVGGIILILLGLRFLL